MNDKKMQKLADELIKSHLDMLFAIRTDMIIYGSGFCKFEESHFKYVPYLDALKEIDEALIKNED